MFLIVRVQSFSRTLFLRNYEIDFGYRAGPTELKNYNSRDLSLFFYGTADRLSRYIPHHYFQANLRN